MIPSLILLAFAGVGSAAGTVALKGFRGQASYANTTLVRRQSCPSGQTTCDLNYCIEDDASCCFDGNGASCGPGDRCVTGGCCPIGEICTGEAECDSGQTLCGTFCISDDDECCDDDKGFFCTAGDSCSSDGLCEVGTGGSGGSNSSDDSNSNSSDDSNSSSDDSDNSSADDDNTSRLCSRSPKKGGSVDINSDGGGDDGCDEPDGAGVLNIPYMLIGLFAFMHIFV